MIVVDVETTGQDTRACSILSIGAVNHEKPKEIFYIECRAFRSAVIDPKELERNGFTIEQARNPEALPVAAAVEMFVAWFKAAECKDKTLAGQRVGSFDQIFLELAIKRAGLKPPFGYLSVDLHSVARFHMKTRGLKPPVDKNGNSALSLDRVLKYCGLEPETIPHHARTGAKLEAEAFSRLERGVGLLAEYSKFQIPQYLKRFKTPAGIIQQI